MKNLFKIAICIALLMSSVAAWAVQGRIAVVADGNFLDADDIAGTPLTIAVIRMFNQQSKLVHFTYACDTRTSYAGRELKLKNGLEDAASLWGGFDQSVFFNGHSQRQASIDNLKAEINSSSASDILWISEAGEPDIIYLAMQGAQQIKRQYVKIVTHHPHNDIGNVYDLSDIEALPGTPTTMVVRITDQNLNLKKKLFEYNWMNNYGDDRVQLLWDYGVIAEQDVNYPQIRTYFDPSDAGIMWYILTGNDQNCTPTKLKNKIDTFISNNPNQTGIIAHMQKSNSTGFAIDGGAGGANNQPVELGTNSASNINQQWDEIDQGGGYYSYKKKNTNFALDGGNNGIAGQLVKLYTYNSTNQNQQWKKISVGSNKYVLEKRNAVGLSIDGGTGGVDGRQLKLWATNTSNGNQQWLFSNASGQPLMAKPSSSAIELNKADLTSDAVSVSPNPATTEITIGGIDGHNCTVNIYNSNGKMVGTYVNSKVISVSSLPVGVYVLKVKSNTINKTLKFIKEN